jgi:phosphate starvation-inducible protein PhoH and related proteins
VIGEEASAKAGEQVLRALYAATENEALNGQTINVRLAESGIDALNEQAAESAQDVVIKVKRGVIKGRGPNQARYLHAITTHDINFGVGPAGTGKTYLAVASAVEALEANRVQRVLLVRPAVEAGEKLGFLPGDLQDKVDPYLRPLYDALFDLIDYERVTRLLEKRVIEVAPLAFMRGRTLGDAFIILDEAQNTTSEQMKMFLTRIGFGSKAVVTGDVTQIDLPQGKRSGLVEAERVLSKVEGIEFVYFTEKDVVRHRLVQMIIKAYESHTSKSNL